jgi:small subunit ribosomal protein S27e
MKRRILIPQPKSNFIKVKCPECGNEQITFNKSNLTVVCNICGAVLLKPSGGKAILVASAVETLE